MTSRAGAVASIVAYLEDSPILPGTSHLTLPSQPGILATPRVREPSGFPMSISPRIIEGAALVFTQD